MRFLRTLAFALTSVLVVSTAWLTARPAYADDVSDAEKEAAETGVRAEAVAGLVDAAIANRAEVEAALVATITRISDLSAELSVVAAGLTKVEEQIVYADAELTNVESEIEVHAVDAYMNAITYTPMSFVNTDSVESAMVAGVVIDELVNSGRQVVGDLIVKKRQLEGLRADHQIREEQLADLKAQLDAEVEHLADLFEQADADVAAAIREAAAADAAHRDALSAVEAAIAQQEEQARQDQRPSPPPPVDPDDPSTTSPPPTTPPPTSVGGGWTGKPGVEQWRDLAVEYFPANRVDEALQVMQCESLGDPDAYNPYSGAAGLFQFLPSTWAGTAPKAGFPDASPFDPEANIATAAWLGNLYEGLGLYFWQPWSCRRVLV